MAIRGPASSWLQRTGLPSRLRETGRTDYELYEDEGEFVLRIELPGFERSNIDLTWQDGVLNVAAEHVDDRNDERKTYHQCFRFPKHVVEDDILASYEDGILEIRLPIVTDATSRGTQIEIQS